MKILFYFPKKKLKKEKNIKKNYFFIYDCITKIKSYLKLVRNL